MGFQLGAISEVVYCVGDMAKAHHFFCKYGGMTSTDAVEIGNDLLKYWNLPEGEYETLGGLVFEVLEDMPEEGQSIKLDGYILTINSLEDTRINTIKLHTV